MKILDIYMANMDWAENSFSIQEKASDYSIYADGLDYFKNIIEMNTFSTTPFDGNYKYTEGPNTLALIIDHGNNYYTLSDMTTILALIDSGELNHIFFEKAKKGSYSMKRKMGHSSHSYSPYQRDLYGKYIKSKCGVYNYEDDMISYSSRGRNHYRYRLLYESRSKRRSTGWKESTKRKHQYKKVA